MRNLEKYCKLVGDGRNELDIEKRRRSREITEETRARNDYLTSYRLNFVGRKESW